METIRRHPVGSLKIARGVLATIARVAAMEIEGVAGLAEPDGSVKRAFSRGIGKQPIHIELNDDFARIDISIRLAYGAKITRVCTAVQQAVKDNIQTMTGLAVSKVNVTVAGIAFPGENASQSEPPSTL